MNRFSDPSFRPDAAGVIEPYDLDVLFNNRVTTKAGFDLFESFSVLSQLRPEGLGIISPVVSLEDVRSDGYDEFGAAVVLLTASISGRTGKVTKASYELHDGLAGSTGTSRKFFVPRSLLGGDYNDGTAVMPRRGEGGSSSPFMPARQQVRRAS